MIKAARLLNCKPWELEDEDASWIEWAFACQRAENLVEKELINRAKSGNHYEDD